MCARAKKTRDAPAGGLMGDGASSEAGRGLVGGWVRDTQRARGESEWYVRGSGRGEERTRGERKDTPPSLFRDKGGPGCARSLRSGSSSPNGGPAAAGSPPAVPCDVRGARRAGFRAAEGRRTQQP